MFNADSAGIGLLLLYRVRSCRSATLDCARGTLSISIRWLLFGQAITAYALGTVQVIPKVLGVSLVIVVCLNHCIPTGVCFRHLSAQNAVCKALTEPFLGTADPCWHSEHSTAELCPSESV